MAKILVVDDEKDIRFLISEVLSDEGHAVLEAAHSDAALAALQKENFDLVILDIWLENSDLDGMELLKRLKKDMPNLQILMVSGHGTVEMAVKAIQLGAYDFLEKPFGSDRLLLQVSRALESVKLTAENQTLRLQTATTGQWVGKAAASAALTKAIDKLQGQETRVLIVGETGSGKSLVVRQLAAGQDLKIWSEDLPELPMQGVILVDDITKLNADTQAILLKHLTAPGKKARVLSTATEAIDAACETGQFSKDLYERLAVARLDLPPLRQRLEDMADLCHSLQPHLTFTPELMAALKAYAWPGNVRELRLVLELAALRAVSAPMSVADLALPATVNNAPIAAGFPLSLDQDLRTAREEFERAYLNALLRQHDNNVSQVAKLAGMDRAALHRKLKNLDAA